MLALWLLWDSKPFNASCTPAAFSLHIISRYLYFNVKKGVKVITGTNSSLSPPSLQHCHSRFHLFHHLYSFTTCSTSWLNVIRLCLECLSCFLFTPFFPPLLLSLPPCAFISLPIFVILVVLMRLYCHYIPSALFCSPLFHFVPCCSISFCGCLL